MTVSLDDQIACVKRELSFRHYVYARRVSEGKMTKVTAEREIAAMEAIGATLEMLKAAVDGGAAKVRLMDFLGDAGRGTQPGLFT